MDMQELSRRIQKGADGEDILVWQLQGVTAGSRVKGLAVRCVDEVGRPATAGVKGKVQVSQSPVWAQDAVKKQPKKGEGRRGFQLKHADKLF